MSATGKAPGTARRSFRVDLSTREHAQLRALAKRIGEPATRIVRRALAAYLPAVQAEQARRGR